jgi:hypothetical protein
MSLSNKPEAKLATCVVITRQKMLSYLFLYVSHALQNGNV